MDSFVYTIVCGVTVQAHRSALKHGLSAAEVVGLWGLFVEQVWLDDDRPGRLLRVCCDDAGRWFELVGLVFDGERVLVIHAMRLRRSTVEQVRRAQ